MATSGTGAIATFGDMASIAGVTISGTYDANKCVKYSDIEVLDLQLIFCSIRDATGGNYGGIFGTSPITITINNSADVKIWGFDDIHGKYAAIGDSGTKVSSIGFKAYAESAEGESYGSSLHYEIHGLGTPRYGYAARSGDFFTIKLNISPTYLASAIIIYIGEGA